MTEDLVRMEGGTVPDIKKLRLKEAAVFIGSFVVPYLLSSVICALAVSTLPPAVTFL